MQNAEIKNGGVNSITGRLILGIVVILLILVVAHFLRLPLVYKINNVTASIKGPTSSTLLSLGGTQDLRKSTLKVVFTGSSPGTTPWKPDPTKNYQWKVIQADKIIPDFRLKGFPPLSGSKKWSTRVDTIRSIQFYVLIIS